MVTCGLAFANDFGQRDENVNVNKPPVNYETDGGSLFIDDMNGDNTVAGLEARGWVVLDEDGGGTTAAFYQGVASVFTAYEGPDTGYVAANFNGANPSGVIDQWLISPEITVAAGDTLKFWHRAPDGNSFDDSIYVRYSTTAGITPGSFDQTWGRYLVSETGWAQWVGTFNHSGAIRFAIQYFIFDGGPTGTYSNYIGLDLIEVSGAGGTTVITIAEAREDLDNDFVPDRLGDTVTVAGTVSSINYNTDNFNYVLHDGTAGITTIKFGFAGPEYNMGDVLQVTGEIGQFRGLTQIEPLGDGSSSVVFQGTGGPLPDFTVLTINQFLANAEMYEGELIGFISLTALPGGDPWPSPGQNANFWLTDAAGVDTLVMRIDKETDLDDNPEPTWPKDIIGFGGQFTFSTPPNDGYQLLPRMYSEILPPGTIPVELTSFTANVSEDLVTLNWSTATETNNLGFEVQRRTGSEFVPVAFISGRGTTTEPQTYTYSEIVDPGTYYYRLKQVDFDGTFELFSEVMVEVLAPSIFALEQNYPNPFNPSTKITYSLAADSKVSLKVFDVLGQEVMSLVNADVAAGTHEVDFNASVLGSGIYFYKLEATGADGSNFIDVKKMTLTK